LNTKSIRRIDNKTPTTELVIWTIDIFLYLYSILNFANTKFWTNEKKEWISAKNNNHFSNPSVFEKNPLKTANTVEKNMNDNIAKNRTEEMKLSYSSRKSNFALCTAATKSRENTTENILI